MTRSQLLEALKVQAEVMAVSLSPNDSIGDERISIIAGHSSLHEDICDLIDALQEYADCGGIVANDALTKFYAKLGGNVAEK